MKLWSSRRCRLGFARITGMSTTTREVDLRGGYENNNGMSLWGHVTGHVIQLHMHTRNVVVHDEIPTFVWKHEYASLTQPADRCASAPSASTSMQRLDIT